MTAISKRDALITRLPTKARDCERVGAHATALRLAGYAMHIYYTGDIRGQGHSLIDAGPFKMGESGGRDITPSIYQFEDSLLGAVWSAVFGGQ